MTRIRTSQLSEEQQAVILRAMVDFAGSEELKDLPLGEAVKQIGLLRDQLVQAALNAANNTDDNTLSSLNNEEEKHS